MRFCEQCGTPLREGAPTCERCGSRPAGEPPPARAAEPPAPPPGYATRPAPAACGQAPRPVPSPPPGPAPALPALARPGFPGAAIPPLVAVLAFVVTTAYATAYTLIEWGTLGSADVFLTAAAPSVLAAPFAGYDSVGAWLDYGPFGGGWTIALPLVTVAALAAILLSRTNVSGGGRIAIGSLISAPLALLACASTLLADQLADYPFYELGETVLKASGGGALVGFLGGVLGGLLSYAIRPPLATERWQRRPYY